MGTIDAVADDRRLGEGLEAVCTPSGHVKRDLCVPPQFEALPVAVGRRRGPQVDDDVEDSTVLATDQLCLPFTVSQMESPNHPSGRS